MEFYISDGAVLVSLCPTEISGKKMVKDRDFFEYEPPETL